MVQNKKILFAVMGWGLGHVTRSIPLIDSLSDDNEIILASNGNAIKLLEANYPRLKILQYPDYAVNYPRYKSLLILSIISQLPQICFQMYREYKITQKLVVEEKIQIIISDSRYGVFSQSTPSFFITHQLRFQLTGLLKPLELLGEKINFFLFKKFTSILVIDNAGKLNLSGALSHNYYRVANNLQFIGPFSSINKAESKTDIDVLVSISGPEVQRTLFENIIMRQIASLPGKKVIVLGKPEEDESVQSEHNLKIYNHVTRTTMNQLMNRAKVVVCRSGYSSVMELAALQKKALLIPTPGQTEQEYLAQYLHRMRFFYTVSQHKLNLCQDIKKCYEPDNISKVPINQIDTFISAISLD